MYDYGGFQTHHIIRAYATKEGDYPLVHVRKYTFTPLSDINCYNASRYWVKSSILFPYYCHVT